MSTLNINQFAQVPVRGQLDLQITKSGIISGQISANESATLKAGDPVLLDDANTVVGEPQFLKAAYTDDAIGAMILDVKSASVAKPGVIQVALRFTGPVMWLVAGETINPGQQVELANSSTVDVMVLNTGNLYGIALDPGTLNNLMRVILVGGAGAA